MKNLSIVAFLLGCVLFSTVAFSQEKGVVAKTVSNLPAKEKRFALIIGVDAYQKDISPLYGTVNDAKALRDVLIKSAGFTDERIILMTTDDSKDSDLFPTRGNIIDQLDKLQRVVPADGLILFSFSGHGVSIGNDAFIIPSDGRIYQNAELMRERAIDVLRIKRAIQDTKVKQVIMFLDACRNDPVRAKGDVDNNLTTAYANGFSFDTKNQNIEAYATLYATSFGDRAYEFLDKKTDKWRGYFSYAIEEGLKGSAANDKGEVTLAGLIRYIENTVKESVRINENQKQIPYPTTEGFRNSDLVIAVSERNPPNDPNLGAAALRIKKAENFYNLGVKCPATDFDCKISNYSKAIELNSQFTSAYLNRALSYAKHEYYAEGMRDLAKVIELNPKSAEAYENRGWIYILKDNCNAAIEKDNCDAAIEDFTKAIDLNPKVAGAYYGRAISFEKKENYDAAFRDLSKAIELNPKVSIYYRKRAELYNFKNDFDAAIRDYTKAIEIDPKDPIPYGGRGLIYYFKQDYDTAIRDFTKAIEIEPRFADAYNNRGSAYMYKKDYDAAIRDFTKLIELYPKHAEYYHNRGFVYALKNNYDAAIRDFTKAIEINPKYLEAYDNRAFAYEKIGEIAKAKADRQKYKELGGQ